MLGENVPDPMGDHRPEAQWQAIFKADCLFMLRGIEALGAQDATPVIIRLEETDPDPIAEETAIHRVSRFFAEQSENAETDDARVAYHRWADLADIIGRLSALKMTLLDPDPAFPTTVLEVLQHGKVLVNDAEVDGITRQALGVLVSEMAIWIVDTDDADELEMGR